MRVINLGENQKEVFTFEVDTFSSCRIFSLVIRNLPCMGISVIVRVSVGGPDRENTFPTRGRGGDSQWVGRDCSAVLGVNQRRGKQERIGLSGPVFVYWWPS